MNRKLLRQTATEWRINLWLALELLVVSVVAWYVTDYLYVTWQTVSRPKGFDTDHCYMIELRQKSPHSPEYIPGRTAADLREDSREIIERLKRVPGVEYACGSSMSFPYSPNMAAGDHTFRDTITINARRRFVTPDFVRVFRYEETGGNTDRLVAALERGDVVVSENLFEEYPGVADIIGDTLTAGGRIGAVTKRVLVHEYFTGSDRYVMSNIWSADAVPSEVCVRVRPEADRDFARTLMASAEKNLRVGNLYVSGVTPINELRDAVLRHNTQQTRSYVAGMAFVLINIFLGLLGTFWFRTRERECEIAIRKVNGATRADIFRRMTGEGMLILTAVTVVAAGIDILLARYSLNCMGLDGRYLDWGRLAACVAITYGVMAVMILAGISIPARRAMNMAPAAALHDE